MGHKGKSSSKKKSKNHNKKQKRKQVVEYKTRREKLLDEYPECVLQMWFGDDEEKRKKFGDFLIKQENIFYEASLDSLIDGNGYYEDKLDKVMNKPCKNINELIIASSEIKKLKKKIRKGKKYSKSYGKKDLGMATYLNSNRYKKKFLDKNKYRKELKSIAKREKKERDEMIKLGYIKSRDPDKELNKLLKANQAMSHALSDAYTQKHFID